MAQSPFRPLDNGRLTLPPVDGAMNKVGPSALPGGKGDITLRTQRDRNSDQKLLEKIRKRMARAISAESDNRKAALDDLKMRSGEQWPSDVVAQRTLDHRPCLTINKFPTFIHQITNDQRQNRPAININPVGDRGDPEVAKMFRGMIRAIERDCSADIAYDTAFDNAVTNGFGYFRFITEYEAPDSMNQVIVIRRVRNPFVVYMDPSHIEPDGSDAEWCFFTEMISREEFEDKWPNADPMPYTEAGIGDTLLKEWATKDEIRIAEYFEIKHETRTLVALSNGHVGWEDELDDIVKAHIERGDIEIKSERESDCPKIKWYKVTALDVLSEKDWAGKWIPIVKVIGDEVDVEGKVKLSGIIRHAKDAQRMYNYWCTSETELVALSPKAPWIMEEGQVEGHEEEWRMANIRSNPYLLYKGTSIAGRPAPPPARQQFGGPPLGVIQAKQGAAQDMMATTGIRFDSTMNERLMDESGKAIRELRRSGDIGAFGYVDNLARSLRHAGQIMLDLIPKIYDAPRVVTILREDDSQESVKIDPTMGQAMGQTHAEDGKVMKLFNPTYGRYGVTVTIGPSFATKRIEASENMIAFARALPQTAHLFADLIAKNQDWPGAEEIATRIAKTLPPNLLMPEQKDMSPQVQALLVAMDGQIKQLTGSLQQAMTALQDKGADRAIEMDKIEKNFEAALLKVVADFEAKAAQTQEKAQASWLAHVGGRIENLAGEVVELKTAIERGDSARG